MIFNPKSYVNLILVSLTRTGGKKQSSRFSRTWGALMESAVHILSAATLSRSAAARISRVRARGIQDVRASFAREHGEQFESAASNWR